MENQTSFDLNLAIQCWRENLAQSSALRNENLNELESHLRDSIATLQTAGLSGEEAFAIANRRIGAAQQLEAEFAKVNAKSVWLDRLLWMLIGVQAWMAISMFCSTATFYAGRVASHVSMQQGYYSDAQRKWITTHGPGAAAIVLELLGLFATPVVLAFAVIIAWKSLLNANQNKRKLMDMFLAKPVRLGFFLFVICFGFQFVAGSFQEFGEHQWHWWQIVLMQITYVAPQYLVGSGLVTILARKRLSVGVVPQQG